MPRRLYLDTADLLDIGDGKVEAARCALVDALTDTGTVLLVSREHLHDTAKDESDSLVRAVESFPTGLVAGVQRGPDEVEPLTADRCDIEALPLGDFRGMVDRYRTQHRETLGKLVEAYEVVHTSDVVSREYTRAVGLTRIATKKGGQLFWQAYMVLCLMPDAEPEIVLAESERILGITLTSPDERRSVIEGLRGARVALSELRPMMVDQNIDARGTLEVLGRWISEPEIWPGQALGLLVSTRRRRNIARKPMRSDLIDHDHAKHLAYVDVATCDGGTLPLVQAAMQELKLPRRPVVLQNGRLELVADEIRALGRDDA